MPPKYLNVQLQSGITQAILPDHRTMKPGISYVVDWETFQKISNGARANVITASPVATGSAVWMSSNGNPNLVPNTVLTTPTATIYGSEIGGNAAQGVNGAMFNSGITLGVVAQGPSSEKFMYVQCDSNGCSSGDVLVWSDESNRIVTSHRPAVTRGITNVGSFAGVAIANMTASYYGFIQTEGECDAVSTSHEILAGNPLIVDASNNGKAMSEAEVVSTVTITGTPTGGTFTLTWNGLTTATIAYNAAGSAVLSALQALSGFPTNGSQSGGALPGTPVVITTYGTALPITGNFSGLTGGTSPTGTVVNTNPVGTGISFGTALTTSNTSVQADIRSPFVKRPYRRFLNKN